MIQEMDLMEIFYWFHRHPELSYEEYDTTAQIKKLLKAADVKDPADSDGNRSDC